MGLFLVKYVALVPIVDIEITVEDFGERLIRLAILLAIAVVG